MRKFIALQEVPNELTISAMQEADRKEGQQFNSANDLFKDLGI
jgi:antitoxin component of RelBE/YafQ-DinJ toxin-antitoxin module